MRLISKLYSLSVQVFVWYPKRSVSAVILLIGVALMDALSVISLIPAIEFLSKTAELSKFTIIINDILQRLGIEFGLVTYFCVSAVVIVLKSCLRFASKVLLIKIQTDYETQLGHLTLKALLHADSNFIECQERGHLVSLLSLEIQKIGECLFYIYDYFSLVLKFIFYFSVLMAFSLPLVLIIIVTSALTFVPSMLLGKAIYNASENRLKHSSSVMDYLGQIVANTLEIKAYSGESFFSRIYTNKLSKYKKAHGKMLLRQDLTGIVLEPFAIIQIILIVFLSLNYFGLTFPETLIVLFTLRSTLPLFGQMMTYKQVLISGIPSFDHVQALMNDLKANSENHSGLSLNSFEQSIELSHVNFSYQDQKILSDISLSIKKGTSIALVGASGAGKTTLLKILMGVLKPTSGTIKVDNISIQDLSISSWRKFVGFVPQEPILLRESLRSNIAIAQSDIDEKKLLNAINKSNLDKFIDSLDSKAESIIGRKGLNLSSGQKQRISFARLLYKDPEVIFLDEPTSALDAESEAFIKKTIDDLKQDRTFVMIAHRLNTIKSCDLIYVMEQGRIVESGTYENLLALNGKFSNLVKLQGL